MNEKRVIWSNINLNFDEWIADYIEECPDATEDELYAIMYAENDEYLEDERLNLDISLPSPIIVIADLGLWNGRRQGYKIIDSGNIKDCLYDNSDCCEWYIDENGDLRCTAHHHDGTNYYLYRMVDEENIDELQDKLYFGRATDADIEEMTERIGDRICDVYGWKLN